MFILSLTPSSTDIRTINRHGGMRRKMWGSAAAVLLAGQALAPASVVFQADFNGSGSGTGGSSNIVTSGGTGTIFNNTNSNVVPTIGSSTPVTPGAGGYLNVQDNGLQTTGGTGGGVTFTPTSAANSFDSWLTQNGAGTNKDSVVGAFDFFFVMNNMGGTFNANSLRFFDMSGGANGMRLILNNSNANRLQLELINVSNSALNVTASNPSGSPITFTQGTLYHVAGTATTNMLDGRITMSLYLAEGNTAIDTTSATHRIGQATSSGSYDVTQAFNSANGFNFGYLNNSVADTKALELDSFRVYNSVPTTFGTIPEPGTAVMALVGVAGLWAVRRRRV
jgi:MYXO-CTERM domain-containing protein